MLPDLRLAWLATAWPTCRFLYFMLKVITGTTGSGRLCKSTTTGFLLQEQCQDIIERNDANIHHYDVSPDKFLEKANAINEVFHANEILASDRAKVMAALLLALAQNKYLRIYDEPQQLIEEINSNVKTLLRKCGKEGFANEVTIRPPASKKNHHKYRSGIVQALQHLRDMNIRSAINSGDDALGKFYETFLSYAKKFELCQENGHRADPPPHHQVCHRSDLRVPQ